MELSNNIPTGKQSKKFIADSIYELKSELKNIIEISSQEKSDETTTENVINSARNAQSIAENILAFFSENTDKTESSSHDSEISSETYSGKHESKNIIDTKKGMMFFSNDKSEYLNILEIMYNDGKKQMDGLKKCIEEKDFKTYINKLYSLKSISSNIGAKPLYKIIKAHENAYKNYDFEFINKNFSILIKKFKATLCEIQKILYKENIFPHNETDYSTEYNHTGVMFMKAAEYIDRFDIDSAKSELEAIYNSDDTDWIQKQVIKRAVGMIESSCYQDTRNLVIALARGEKI